MRSSWTISTCTLLTTLGAILFDNANAFTYPPVAAPLVVKTPYLNTWLYGKDANIANSWPRSGGNTGITGWAGLARVDGVGCNYLGNGSNGTQIAPSGQLQSTTITATQTQYVVRCGGVDLKVTYLSPIEPSDFVRLSLPFTYLSVTASPNDGRQHSVQVYADLAGEWLGPDSAAVMTWSTQKTQTMVYHQFQLASPTQFGSRDDRVTYGHAYHGILLDTGVTYQTAPDVNLRTWFNSTGTLNNTQDTTSRAIGDRWPCMALSKDLGSITAESKPVVFVVGLTRDPAISYQTSGGPQARSLYYRAQLSNDEDALSFFLNDYDNAVASANNFDGKVNSAAAQISNDYVDLAVLAARQTFAHVELTVSTGSDGNLNKSDPLLFMGLDGVNSLDEIYASSPFWAWANPDLLGLLLQPIVQWHRNIGATNAAVGNRVIDNLGSQYPQANGPQTNALNAKSLESTADLMLSTAAFVKAKGDYSIVEDNMDLYKSWGNFLKDNALYPASQLTSDGDIIGSPTNDTNLAAKSIIALKAFSDILTSMRQDASAYHDSATNYASTWQQIAASSTAFSMSYGNPSSWSMVYNLFCDKWLKTGLFTDDVYSKLGSLYSNNMNTYGLALNSNTTLTSPHWMMFAAGLAPETSTRDLLIARTKNFIQNGDANVPWASYIGATNGKAADNTFNRASIGGVYALLVRDLEPAPSASSAMPSYPSSITVVTSFVLLFTLSFLH